MANYKDWANSDSVSVDLSGVYEEFSSVQKQLDKLETKLDRIEKLIEAIISSNEKYPLTYCGPKNG
jgi:phage-related minor tail protein